MAGNLFCRVNFNTYIWTNIAIHECPYQLVEYATLKVRENIATGENSLFKLTSSSIACNITIFKTNVGLYLTLKNNTRNLRLVKSTNDINVEHELLLSDSDSKAINIVNMINNANNKAESQICELLRIDLEMMSKRIDEYFILTNLNGSAIVYNRMGELILCDCTNVTMVWVQKIDTCYEDIGIV